MFPDHALSKSQFMVCCHEHHSQQSDLLESNIYDAATMEPCVNHAQKVQEIVKMFAVADSPRAFR